MRTTHLFPTALMAVLAMFLFACEDPEFNPATTLSIHQLLADDIQAELDSLDTTPGTENDAVDTDLPITEIEMSNVREALEKQMKEERVNAKSVYEQLCGGTPNCMPLALSRIGDPCGKGKCYDFLLFRRWACRYELPIRISVFDMQNNLVFESLNGNEKEQYKRNGAIRLITIPAMTPGQYQINFQTPGMERNIRAVY
jgi:hypothetical protein